MIIQSPYCGAMLCCALLYFIKPRQPYLPSCITTKVSVD